MPKLSNVILRIALAATWQQCKRELCKYQDILLSQDAERWILAALEAIREEGDGGEERFKRFSLILDLLKKCRNVGIERAFEECAGNECGFAGAQTEGEAQQLMDRICARRALSELFNARTQKEANAVIADQGEFIFTKAADDSLADNMKKALDARDEAGRRSLQHAQMLVVRGRREMKQEEPKCRKSE